MATKQWRIALAGLLLLAAGKANAGEFGLFRTLMLTPSARVAPGQVVGIEATFQNTLYIEPYADVERVGNVVRIVVYGSDVTEPNLTTRNWTLGSFERGTYTVEIYQTPAVLPPGVEAEPTFVYALTLQVGAAPVPVFPAAHVLSAIGLAAVGLLRLRSRRRDP